MARRSTKAVAPGDGRIVDIDVSDEMRASFLEYAYSVIYARALPDARDGLKPVQRRILFQMAQMGLRPERGHVKSARVVGEVMGRLHPHGDSAIYDALVRMAQPFTLRLPMVDGHGNFGSPDDGPAAMRYTEARLAAAALDMTLSLDEDVVDFVPNYDGRETEPTVLPAAIPNLLVNGASGIAVGMATTLVPHNLGEVIGATRYLIKNPKADLGEIMKFIPGPDLPGGGVIIGLAGVREAYESGRGTFRIRARTRIDQVSPRRRGIIVTELPMNVGPERVIERIKDLVQSKKLLGIADVTDLTDGDSGLNLVIDIKNGFHAEAVLENLFKLTPMEESVNINAVALVEGQPQTLGLLTLLHVFIDHRLEVVRRRSLFRRTKAQDRLHLVAGLLTAILDIDEVIQLIRESDDAAAAKARLIEVFDLSEVQSSYILEMPLRRLTKFSRIELEKESDVLKREIEELTKILDNDSELRALVSDELAAIAQAHATPRRTLLMEAGAAPISAAVPLEVDDEPCVVLMSSTGLLARTADQRFEQVGDIARANHDVIISAVPATNRGSIGLVTSTGTLIRLSVVDLPALPSVIGIPALSAGAQVGAFVDLPLGESALCLTTLDETGGIALATANGVVKRVLPDGLTNKDSWEIIRLDEGDQVVGAIGLDEAAAETSELVFVTSDGQLLRFAASAVRPQGRAAGGMAGVRLAPGARVTSFTALTPAASAVVVTIAGSADALPGTDAGSIKITPLAEYPAKGRGTGGVRCHKFRSGEDTLVLAWVGIGPARAATASGVPADLPTVLGKRDGTGSPGTTPISGLGGQL
ncbi:MAG: DNA topoisomerase 4 subunit A [Actinobacteria bacterium]|uniref:DNA topoisomerase (ATP-hydrolyzing) n=1 Tax=freshwater metagenome TaxID=449393 RepID=A0A6J6ZKI2_9ZZZZ|nr:DNA topoisomerase 4 subunit A [Actinomycetota bacterium]